MTTTNLQNPWRYVQADSIKDNPYLNSPKDKKENGKKPAEDAAPTGTPTVITSAADFLLLENITCVDSNNNPFEKYDKLQVRKDIFRNGQNGQLNFTPYNAAVHCEQNGLFLPSFALTCNIVAALYQNKNNSAEAKKLLDMYKDKGDGNGWHAQNTVINWGTQEIIHYPRDADFPVHGGKSNINKSQPQLKLLFNRTGFKDTTLVDGLQIPNFKRYVQNLTGLQNPSILDGIGSYFGRTTHLWVSSTTKTRAAWFGCSSDYLDLGGDDSLDGSDAARGVKQA